MSAKAQEVSCGALDSGNEALEPSQGDAARPAAFPLFVGAWIQVRSTILPERECVPLLGQAGAQ